MDKLLVVGRRSIAQDLVASLQKLGVVQIDPVDLGDVEAGSLGQFTVQGGALHDKDAWEAALARSRSLLSELNVNELETEVSTDAPTDLSAVQRYLETASVQTDRLVAERAEIRDELDVLATYLPPFRDIAPTLAQLEQGQFLTGLAFFADEDALAEIKAALEEELEYEVVVSSKPSGKQRLAVAALLRKDRANATAVLSRSGHAALTLPEAYRGEGTAKAVHVMEERSQNLPERLAAIDTELAKLKEQHGSKLLAVYDTSLNHHERYAALADMAEGRYSFALQGWVPSKERTRVVDAVTKQYGSDVAVEARAADDHHDKGVPTKLENPGWVKPFEGLLALFAPPKYGTFDPSWTLAVFFPFFFGLVVGDMGFGLMFAAIAWWMRRRGESGKALDLGPLGIVIKPAALLPISTVIFWSAAWSVVFGFVYGEFFGNFLEHWPHDRPIFYVPEHAAHGEGPYGIIPILLFRVEKFTPLLLASIGFGILQVLGGWAIRAYYGYRHGDKKHLWEGIGMFSGLSALVLFAAAFLTDSLGPTVNLLVILGFAIFVVSVVLSQMWLMLIEIISNSGAILSYLRLFAVGLSAALVANLATDLGFAIGGTLPIIGPILGILVGLAVHLIAIALTIIGHTLQPLRLQYVEFFTKFGFYDENGRPYRPLRLNGGKA